MRGLGGLILRFIIAAATYSTVLILPAIDCELSGQLGKVSRYEIIKNELSCRLSATQYGDRNILLLIAPGDFNPGSIESITRELSLKFPDPDELFISIQTDREIADWMKSPHPFKLPGQLFRDETYERVKNKKTLCAYYYRLNGSEILRYMIDPQKGSTAMRVLSGADATYSRDLGFRYEIVQTDMTKDADGMVCIRRDVGIIVRQSDFHVETLSRLFRYVDRLYPIPQELRAVVYTNEEQFTKVNPGVLRQFPLRLQDADILEKGTSRDHLSASFYRDGNSRYFTYTLFPFVRNSYGGLKEGRVILHEGK